MTPLELTIQRYASNNESTLGLFFVDCKYQCYTLEDEFRSKKVYGETRIPAGRYRIEFRTEGGFHDKYLERFGADFHKGMLHVTGVPGFKWILIHIGNDDDDTAGCILVGNDANNVNVKQGYISDSKRAYLALYPIIRDALLQGREVWLNVRDEGQMDFTNLAA